jgi:ABC-type glycerol-3-phosphate transport system substrate-binding protein
MSKVRRALCLIYALAILGSFFVMADTFDGEDQSAFEPSLTADRFSYAVYSRAATDAPEGETQLLPLAKQELSDGAEAETDGEAGQVLSLPEGGQANWLFQVPEDARYCLQLTYLIAPGGQQNGEIAFLLNGEAPFNESAGLALKRVWRDETEILRDTAGNDLIPKRVQIEEYSVLLLRDYSALTNSPFLLKLSGGELTLSLVNQGGAKIFVADVRFVPAPKAPADETYLAAAKADGLTQPQGYYHLLEAERTFQKSDVSLYPQYDRADAGVSPYSVRYIRRNIIGSNWWEPGMWLEYEISDVPSDGLYYLTFKYRQSYVTGVSVFRKVEVNGETQCQSMETVPFAYSDSFKNAELTDAKGEPLALRLKKGRNVLRFTAILGPTADILSETAEIRDVLNDLYIQMVMITGVSTDKYRDYYLDKELPQLLPTLEREEIKLRALVGRLEAQSGEKNGGSQVLRRAADQLASLRAKPETIPVRISNFRDTVSSLSAWVYDGLEQPLELDYFIVHSADQPVPAASAGFSAVARHFFGRFFFSFFDDYNSLSGTDTQKKAIKVWMNSGRDQAQILKNLVTNEFAPSTGIPVEISLVQTGFIEATLSGNGPDAALSIERGQPVNLACRGALEPLEGYPGFAGMITRFGSTATVPYQYNGHTFALPDTQTFFVLFARDDILARAGLSPPETWDELRRLLPRLQKNHMQVGLPYSVISAAAAVNAGMGAKDIFPSLLLQSGASLYNGDGSEAALSTEQSQAAFKTWCDFYTQYGFDLIYDAYSRFKSGEMPLLVAAYDFCNQLVIGAPEIRGKWRMLPMLGTQAENGSVNRTVAGAGSADVIFKKAKDKESCFIFLDWWSTAQTQLSFAQEYESATATGWRYPTANIEAFDAQGWTRAQLTVIEAQRGWVRELREIPGSYYVSRSLDNGLRSVLFDKKNPIEALQKQTGEINREITRKRRELGLQ